MFRSAVWIAMAYLVGSIPTSYLAGRWLKGIDLRRYGSGTVSGTGAYYHVSRPAVVVVGLLDIAAGQRNVRRCPIRPPRPNARPCWRRWVWVRTQRKSITRARYYENPLTVLVSTARARAEYALLPIPLHRSPSDAGPGATAAYWP